MIDAAGEQEKIDLFLTSTMESRALSEKCRDYFDHKQWTAAEIQKLKSRNQAAIVVNRIRPKIKGLVGLYNMRQSDPKAYPRTQKHDKSAHAITDALRYVADDNDFQTKKLEVCEEFFVEGYSGCIVEVRQGKTDIARMSYKGAVSHKHKHLFLCSQDWYIYMPPWLSYRSSQ